MRGDDQKQTAMFSYLTLAQRIPGFFSSLFSLCLASVKFSSTEYQIHSSFRSLPKPHLISVPKW